MCLRRFLLKVVRLYSSTYSGKYRKFLFEGQLKFLILKTLLLRHLFFKFPGTNKWVNVGLFW